MTSRRSFERPISAKADMGWRNMLMKGVTHYGLASATGENGRRYWVPELGN